MISLFQILNKNKNSKKILKVKKCENVDSSPFLILPSYSKQKLYNIFKIENSSSYRRRQQK